jgi:hypothetical protein
MSTQLVYTDISFWFLLSFLSSWAWGLRWLFKDSTFSLCIFPFSLIHLFLAYTIQCILPVSNMHYFTY